MTSQLVLMIPDTKYLSLILKPIYRENKLEKKKNITGCNSWLEQNPVIRMLLWGIWETLFLVS